MAKPSKREALADWRKAEAKYREILDDYLAENSSKSIDKDAAVEIAKARAKADRHLDSCLHRLLD
jgi:hypothetical protein